MKRHAYEDSALPRLLEQFMGGPVDVGASHCGSFLRVEGGRLAFVPVEAFEALARVLPGRLIAFGIRTMVTVIRGLNLGPTAETAKAVEQWMAVSIFFLITVIGGMVLLAILRAMRRVPAV